MSNYMESKKQLDAIRDKYGCKGEVLFRTAIQTLLQYGQENFQYHHWFNGQIIGIEARHDRAEEEGKWLFMTRDFEKAIWECAKELSKINSCDLLMYIQREVWLGGNGISYQRSIDMLKECISYYTYGMEYDGILADMTEELGFDENEIVELGFEYLFDDEEEEE